MIANPRKLLVAFAGMYALGAGLSAQTTATPPEDSVSAAAGVSAPTAAKPKEPAADDEVVVLSPFEVSADSEVGYQARETIAGGRLRQDLKDVSAQVDVMTQEFISDLGINSLEDALKYSLSIDSQSEWYDPSGSENTLGGNPFNPSAGNRARGLARASTSVGFFETSTSIDSYNTERYSFVGGPNAILFGNGMAGGSVDTSYKRAGVNKNKYSVSLQLDTEDGYRGTLDVNQVLVKRVLAVRFNALKQDIPAGRMPSYDKSERYFGTISFEPIKELRVRAYAEEADIQRAPIRSTLVQDKVTPYFKALERGSDPYTIGSGSSAITYPGRPAQPGAVAKYLETYDPSVLLPYAFDNSTINSYNLGANSTAMTNALKAQGFAHPTTSSLDILSRNSSSRPVLVLGGAENVQIPITPWNNTGAWSNGPGNEFGDTADWSFVDGDIYPTQINIVGNALQQSTRSKVRGFIIEFNPAKNLFIEYGRNREEITYRFRDVLGTGQTELAIDLNRYLPAMWAPNTPMPTRVLNPNFGRYFVESGVSGGDNQQEKAEDRLTGTYTLDFTKNDGWSRWLGVHRFLGVWTDQMSQRFEQVRNGASAANVVSDNDFTVTYGSTGTTPLPPALSYLTNNNYQNRWLQVRNYLGSPTAGVGGKPYVDLKVDPWDWGTMGVDASGNPVVVAGDDLPGGGNAWNISNGRKETEGLLFSIQSAFLNNRLILNYGRRTDDNSYTNWLDGSAQPRYDPATGGYYFPVSGVPTPAQYANAPYMNWQNFKKLGLERMQRISSRQEENPTSVSKGVVVHPLSWFSLFYNESTSAYAAEFSRFNHDGSAMTIDDGTGQDYGFTIGLPSGNLSLRVDWFESTRQGGNSPFQGKVFNLMSIRDTVYYVEKTFLNLNPGFDIAGNQYAYYIQSVQDAAIPSGITSTTNFAAHNFTVAPNRERSAIQADRKASGVEVTLTANPIRGLSLSLKAADTETVSTNTGFTWFQYMDARWADWETMANQPVGGGAIPNMTYTMSNYFRDVISPTLSFIKAAEGMPNMQERRYKVNLTGRYGFQGGALKGFYFGANYTWRSETILGFVTRAATPEDVYRDYPDVVAGSFDVMDMNAPIKGPTLTSLDGFAGYKRKFNDGRLEWVVQLNVRNLLDDNELIPQRAFSKRQPDGTTPAWITNYNVPDPRRFILTNTINF